MWKANTEASDQSGALPPQHPAHPARQTSYSAPTDSVLGTNVLGANVLGIADSVLGSNVLGSTDYVLATPSYSRIDIVLITRRHASGDIGVTVTSLMRAKTRAEPEVFYYLLQVQERALARVASSYDATCIQYNLYCTRVPKANEPVG